MSMEKKKSKYHFTMFIWKNSNIPDISLHFGSKSANPLWLHRNIRIFSVNHWKNNHKNHSEIYINYKLTGKYHNHKGWMMILRIKSLIHICLCSEAKTPFISKKQKHFIRIYLCFYSSVIMENKRNLPVCFSAPFDTYIWWTNSALRPFAFFAVRTISYPYSGRRPFNEKFGWLCNNINEWIELVNYTFRFHCSMLMQSLNATKRKYEY